jgi:iron complex outermembrane recepter protein
MSTKLVRAASIPFRWRWAAAAFLLALLTAPVWAQQNVDDAAGGASNASAQDGSARPAAQTKSLTDLDLDQLMNVQIKVTSVSKKEEDSFTAPAAIFVLTAEDIRRGGFSSLAEALRMVPGLYVARGNADSWTIAARGFAFPNNDKLLVLVDGRNVYDPFFGGIYWDVQDFPLDNVERIEVIRGPGGTLWGDNAVNGVINIVTKKAADTQGFSATTSYGLDQEQSASVRYGGKIGQNLSYRIYGKSSYWDPSVDASGASLFDEWSLSQGGVRVEDQLTEKDALTVDAGLYQGDTHNTQLFAPDGTSPLLAVRPASLMRGQNIQARWQHTFSESSSIDVLGYCQWTKRENLTAGSVRNDCDVEFQHNVIFGERQSINWGASVDTTGDQLVNNFTAHFTPESRRTTTVAGFAQYEVQLIPDRVRLIAGTKLEHNDYTGFEVQPQIRAVWTPSRSQTVWGAVSRAISLPTRVQTAGSIKLMNISTDPITYFDLLGDPKLNSEALVAYELGYRYKWKDIFSFDGTIYYNDYSRLIGAAPGAPIVNPAPFYIEIPEQIGNYGRGQTHGAEFYVKIRPVRRWVVSAGITELRGATSTPVDGLVGMPRHWSNIQSRLDLVHTFEFDSAIYYYDATKAGAVITEIAPTHSRVDLGISARPVRGLTLSVWGQDITSARNLENTTPNSGTVEIGEMRRSVVFKMTWQSNSEQRKSDN